MREWNDGNAFRINISMNFKWNTFMCWIGIVCRFNKKNGIAHYISSMKWKWQVVVRVRAGLPCVLVWGSVVPGATCFPNEYGWSLFIWNVFMWKWYTKLLLAKVQIQTLLKAINIPVCLERLSHRYSFHFSASVYFSSIFAFSDFSFYFKLLERRQN